MSKSVSLLILGALAVIGGAVFAALLIKTKLSRRDVDFDDYDFDGEDWDSDDEFYEVLIEDEDEPSDEASEEVPAFKDKKNSSSV